MSLLETKTLKGWLISGAGNTFAIEFTTPGNTLSGKQAEQVCKQFKVDGYLGLTAEAVDSGPNQTSIKKNPMKFAWNFYNSDGSDAEFCGNAARCAQNYINKVMNSSQNEHETTAGIIQTNSINESDWVIMPKPKILQSEKSVAVDGQAWTGFWCNTGVPHFVLQQPRFRHDLWLKLSSKLRHHPDFGPRGSNITWVDFKRASQTTSIQAVTFERGVEDFTQACGTGALAAAFAIASKADTQSGKNNFKIAMPGGVLEINLHETSWMMTGPVEKLGDWSRT